MHTVSVSVCVKIEVKVSPLYATKAQRNTGIVLLSPILGVRWECVVNSMTWLFYTQKGAPVPTAAHPAKEAGWDSGPF